MNKYQNNKYDNGTQITRRKCCAHRSAKLKTKKKGYYSSYVIIIHNK